VNVAAGRLRRRLQRLQGAPQCVAVVCRRKVTRTGKQYPLATTQGRQVMAASVGARRIARRLHQEPGFAHEMVEAPRRG